MYRGRGSFLSSWAVGYGAQDRDHIWCGGGGVIVRNRRSGGAADVMAWCLRSLIEMDVTIYGVKYEESVYGP